MRALLLIATVIVSGLSGSAAAPPKFEDFLVTDIFTGTPVAPQLSTAQARRFRTQLRTQAPRGPDFAGHFKLALWGCGAGCVFVSVIDSISGEVDFAPFSFQDAWTNIDGRPRVSCHHSSDFRLDSELYIVQGSIHDKAGTHYYRWHDKRFTLVHFEPDCSIS